MRILKVGGNELAEVTFLNTLARAVAVIRESEQVVVVHGGGQSIADLHTQLGIPTHKVDGLRITSARSLQIAEMVLSGDANKTLVRAFLAAGIDAIGISGVDGGLLKARKKVHPAVDLGYVGEVMAVRAQLLASWLDAGWLPVVSPISLGDDGATYNVNADEAATAIAVALGAEQFDFISNVPGVLHNGQIMPALTLSSAEELIARGAIYGGMIPKVRAAIEAVTLGVPRARIVNLENLLDGTAGTTFRAG